MEEMEPRELMEKMEEHEEREEREAQARARLNALVAISIALIATFLGVFKVKDDNLVIRMGRVQAERIDDWNYYQSKNIREEILRSAAAEISVGPTGGSAAAKKAAADLVSKADHEKSEKADLQKEAQGKDKEYEALSGRHDQFDLSATALAGAISLLAIVALTRRRWLYWLAMAPTAGGILMGLAGFAGWNLRPEALMRWLA